MLRHLVLKAWIPPPSFFFKITVSKQGPGFTAMQCPLNSNGQWVKKYLRIPGHLIREEKCFVHGGHDLLPDKHGVSWDFGDRIQNQLTDLQIDIQIYK